MTKHASANLRRPDESSRKPTATANRAGGCCPRCGNPQLHRVPRRWVDRLLSGVCPVFRFRCKSIECQWEGNLRQRRFNHRSWHKEFYPGI